MRKGIYVDGGTALRCGRPFYGMGVNYYSLFNSGFLPEGGYDMTEAKEGLRVLSENGIPFVRINLGGYYWYELERYFSGREAYRAALTEIIAEADRLGIGIIPSFFWLIQCASDYFDEPMRSWGDGKSRTRGFMREYALDMADTLKGFDAVWGWEFGNEFNLGADLPNAALNRPPRKDGSARDASDCISLEDVRPAFEEFARLIRGADADARFITSGNATLRAGQFRIYRFHRWGTDTLEEHELATSLFHPGKMDVVSEHLYFRRERYFGREMEVEEYLRETMDMCRRMRKPLLIGEFGHNNLTEPEPDEERREAAYCRIADAVVAAKVPMSLVWNYDPKNQIEYSFSHKERKGKFLFGLVRRCNEELGRLAKK